MVNTYRAIKISEFPQEFNKTTILSAYGYSVWAMDIPERIQDAKEEVEEFKQRFAAKQISQIHVEHVEDYLRFHENLLKYMQDNQIDVAFTDESEF